MSYVKKTTVARITFEPSHPLHGLEIKSKSVEMSFLTKVASTLVIIQDLGRAAEAAGDPSADSQLALMERLQESLDLMYEMFASKVVSWNFQVEDYDGTVRDVPPTVEGMKSVADDNEVLTILHEWLNALSGVPTSVGKVSSSGATSAELSALTETLSPSLAS